MIKDNSGSHCKIFTSVVWWSFISFSGLVAKLYLRMWVASIVSKVGAGVNYIRCGSLILSGCKLTVKKNPHIGNKSGLVIKACGANQAPVSHRISCS